MDKDTDIYYILPSLENGLKTVTKGIQLETLRKELKGLIEETGKCWGKNGYWMDLVEFINIRFKSANFEYPIDFELNWKKENEK